MGPVETILDRMATRATVAADATHLLAYRALWICACVSFDDAPTWLIYDDLEGTLSWCRLPVGIEVSELLDATFIAGRHADPSGVLAWLEEDAANPWTGGTGWGDESVVPELRRKILGG